MRFFLALVLLAGSVIAAAQAAPEKGGNEVQIWAGGGHSVSGGRGDTGIFNAGLRYGWILTDLHLPGFLRGRFEYALDAVPVFLAFQPTNTAYGVGFDPLGLKWNFQSTIKSTLYPTFIWAAINSTFRSCVKRSVWQVSSDGSRINNRRVTSDWC